MEENKIATSNVEKTRERFEEPIRTYGSAVRSERIWRDTEYIPEVAPTVNLDLLVENPNGFKNGHVVTIPDGAIIRNIVDFYYKLPLERVLGTTNCFSNTLLKNVITADYFGEYYNPIIYIDSNQLAFGVGNPIFDVAAGTLYFNDKDFAEKIKNQPIYVSFFKYVGRIGAGGGNDLPFRDDLKHFRNAENENSTATFKIRGGDKHTNYILPPDNGKWYDKGVEEGGVVLLQENLEDALWEQGVRISGGEWVESNSISSVYKYNAPTIEESQK